MLCLVRALRSAASGQDSWGVLCLVKTEVCCIWPILWGVLCLVKTEVCCIGPRLWGLLCLVKILRSDASDQDSEVFCVCGWGSEFSCVCGQSSEICCGWGSEVGCVRWPGLWSLLYIVRALRPAVSVARTLRSAVCCQDSEICCVCGQNSEVCCVCGQNSEVSYVHNQWSNIQLYSCVNGCLVNTDSFAESMARALTIPMCHIPWLSLQRHCGYEVVTHNKHSLSTQ